MKSHLHQRLVSFVLALGVTVGMLGAVDRLAGLEQVSPQWAAAVMSPRG